MAKNTSVIANHSAYLKRRMIMSRVLGIMACIFALASIFLMYYKLISEWMCIITISYAMATAFTSNGFLQGIKVGNPWQRINMACAIFFYILVVGLVVLGFINGQLSFSF